MTPFVFDTTIFVYAIGREHPYRDPCRAILDQAKRRPVEGGASALVIQEFAHILLRCEGDGAQARAQA